MYFAPDQTWTFTAPTAARCCSCRTGIDPGTECQRGTWTLDLLFSHLAAADSALSLLFKRLQLLD